MANKKYFQGRETFHRVNFLYQAADTCRQLPGTQGKKLMMIYGSHLTSVCRKTVSRIDMHLKRKICKGCCGLLVPGDTAMVRLTKKPESQVLWICTMCGAYRLFNTRPNHRVWRDSPNAIVETIDLNSDGVNVDSLKKSEQPPESLNNKFFPNEDIKSTAPATTKGKDIEKSCAVSVDLGSSDYTKKNQILISDEKLLSEE